MRRRCGSSTSRRGITIRCEEERSQAANKQKGLARLKAKLVAVAETQRAADVAAIRGDAVKAEWGQQIRNYVFHPYKMVKDVRTGYETSDGGRRGERKTWTTSWMNSCVGNVRRRRRKRLSSPLIVSNS